MNKKIAKSIVDFIPFSGHPIVVKIIIVRHVLSFIQY